MDIIESNIVIAQFMGFTPQRTGSKKMVAPDNFNELFGDYLNKPRGGNMDQWFHKDWNWLMPVVQKIESSYQENKTQMITVHIIGRSCSILRTGAASKWNGKALEDINNNPIRIFADTPIEAVYKACLAFILRYNDFNNG